jgi:hypothetical protein
MTFGIMIDTLKAASRKPGGLFALIFKYDSRLYIHFFLSFLCLREQMAEIKRDSLKKYSNLQIFDIICEDVAERFSQSLYILCLFLLSLKETNWVLTSESAEMLFYLWFLLIATEMLVGTSFSSFRSLLLTSQTGSNMALSLSKEMHTKAGECIKDLRST